jgi:hypothetical protein
MLEKAFLRAFGRMDSNALRKNTALVSQMDTCRKFLQPPTPPVTLTHDAGFPTDITLQQV